MKFERPIAEIEKFDLKDVISASGDASDSTTESVDDRHNTMIGQETGVCSGRAEDNYNFDMCGPIP